MQKRRASFNWSSYNLNAMDPRRNGTTAVRSRDASKGNTLEYSLRAVNLGVAPGALAKVAAHKLTAKETRELCVSRRAHPEA